jgi:biopolymer transport protein ExbB
MTQRTGTPFTIRSFFAAIALVAAASPLRAQPLPPDPASETLVESAPVAENGSTFEAGWITQLRQGGLIMIPLALSSFVVFVFVFERAISLRRGRVIPRPFVRRFLDQLESNELTRQEASDLCRQNGSPISEVFEAAVMKWDRPSVEVEQAVIDAGERLSTTLRRHLRLFHGIATLSPLLGLLGTVTGMIRSFRVLAQANAMGRPEMLASGISEALITTAAGLVVAIPAIMAYLFFASRVDRLIAEVDQHGQSLVNAIASDGWKEDRSRKSGKPGTKAA